MKQFKWRFSVKLASPEALKQFLRFRGMSYAELATRTGCSKALIGHLASGRNTHTGVDIARGISKALDVPIDSLFLPDVSTVSGLSSHHRKEVSA